MLGEHLVIRVTSSWGRFQLNSRLEPSVYLLLQDTKHINID